MTKREPKVYKIEGEAFTRINALVKKQQELVDVARKGEKEMQQAIFKEIGITPGQIGNALKFDDQYESTGVYFLREIMPHPFLEIFRGLHAAADGEECPICHEVHGPDEDVTTH